MRSSSVIGALGAPFAVVVGIVVQDDTVESTVAYFACCSGVRGAGGGGLTLGEALVKGVLQGPVG